MLPRTTFFCIQSVAHNVIFRGRKDPVRIKDVFDHLDTEEEYVQDLFSKYRGIILPFHVQRLMTGTMDVVID